MRYTLYFLIAVLTLISIGQSAAPLAMFTCTTSPISRGDSVTFTDYSTNTPTSWWWDFGDSSNSTEQNPVHIYWYPGTFHACLTAINGDGRDVNNTVITVNAVYRAKATTTIAPEPTGPYTTMIEAIGTGPSNMTVPPLLTIFTVAAAPFTAVLGDIAWVILFLIPFLMMWLMQRDLVIPGVAGIILGGVILLRLPSEYQIVATAFIAISITAIVWQLYTSRD